MKKRLVVIGGGPSGLVSAHTFRRCGFDVKLLEPGTLGGEFLAGGLKYIHHTTEMERLLNRLDVPFSPYRVNGGIMLRGAVKPYPEHIWGLPKEEAERIQRDHYRKTRKTLPPPSSTAMNDPSKKGPRRALRCDFQELIDALAEPAPGFEIIKSGAASIGGNEVRLQNGSVVKFDFAITTVPMWILRRLVSFSVPETLSAVLNIAIVRPHTDKYVRWDYVYTPYTPDNVVHRFSPAAGSGYSVEANGTLDHFGLESDLHFIFPDGFSIDTVKEGLKGHLLPLAVQPEWPENLAPIGRFAKWDSRATVDVALDDSISLVERWAG